MSGPWKEFWREFGWPLSIVVLLVAGGLYAYFTDPTRHQTCVQWSGPR